MQARRDLIALKKRSRRWLYVGFAVIALAAIAAWLAMRGGGDEAAGGFRTAAVDRGDIRVVVAATGNLAAVSTVDIGSQVSGQVTEVLGDFNDRVKANDVIARIDPHPFQARVTQAAADLASAQASLASARASLNEAKVVAANATRTFDRTRQIRERGLIAQADLDTAELARDQSQARIAVAQSQLDVASANVAQRQAALDNAKFDLERAVIRSPVDGVIVSRAVERGQTVAASFQTPVLFQIAEDLTQMQIVLAIDEADIGQVVQDQVAKFTVDAFPGRAFSGTVSEVRLAATNTANVITYPVVVAVDNADLALKPGMTANAEIEVSVRQDVLRVPNAALRFKPAEPPGGGMGADRSPAQQREMQARFAQVRQQMRDDIAARLKLDANQQATLDAALAQGRGQGGRGDAGDRGGGTRGDGAADASAGGRRGGGARRQVFVERALAALEPTLRPDQTTALAQYREEMRNLRAAELYVPSPDGPQSRNVRIGLTDGQYTEVVGGAVRTGDVVITGIAGPQANG